MSRKRSNSGCLKRSKTSSCHDVDNGKAEQVCPTRVAFNELQNEIERDLQNSGRILFAANNYLGNTSRITPNRKHVPHNKTECSSNSTVEESFLGQSPSGVVNMKKCALQRDDRSMHSLARHDHGSHQQLESSPHHHHHHHHHQHHHESHGEFPKLGERSLQSLGYLTKLNKSSSQILCELDQDCDVFKTCYPKPKEEKKGKVVKLPEAPQLTKEQILTMIKCESKDVESARYLTSEERRTYKKPCPKQQKALMEIQMTKKSPQTAGKKYSQLEHPEPEDISPDMAAAMMFLQEQGMKMDECPDDTITRLFPQDPRPALPPKGSVSVVNPNQNDQQRMMEKSAGVPSEGVSDSAYTRRMSGKGELGPQKSYDVDFAIGQSKREYVLVNEKPQRINMVRFRGGSTPLWFPWYFSAFPDDEEGLKLVSSPSGLFYKAWLYSNPEHIPTNDVIVLE